jgi:hypothetical protein
VHPHAPPADNLNLACEAADGRARRATTTVQINERLTSHLGQLGNVYIDHERAHNDDGYFPFTVPRILLEGVPSNTRAERPRRTRPPGPGGVMARLQSAAQDWAKSADRRIRVWCRYERHLVSEREMDCSASVKRLIISESGSLWYGRCR